MRRKFTILHLSDLHFGGIAGGDFKHKWPDTSDGLVSRCATALSTHGVQPDFIVISGDLVCDGTNVEQYNTATEEIIRLCDELAVGRDRLIIIPGNHDIDRVLAGDQERLLKFRSVLASVYADGDLRSRVPPPEWDSHNENDYKGWDPSVTVPDFPVNFLLLYSCFTRKDKLVPVMFRSKLPDCGADLDKSAWSLFDRGYVSESQLRKLPLPTDGDPNLRIAIVHHNLIPIPRNFDSHEELQQPDSNLLSNGMEVVEELIAKGVALILHGHRHQYALTVRSQKTGEEYLTVLGAPTAGLHQDRYLGFNVIEITKHNLGWGASIRTFSYGGEGHQVFRPAGDAVEIELTTKPHPYKLLSNRRAVKTLATKLLHSQGGPSILHFTSKANWHDRTPSCKVNPMSEDSPFAMVWDDNESKLIDLAKILFATAEPNARNVGAVKDWISKCREQGYFEEKFLTLLRRNPGRFRYEKGSTNGNAFLSAVAALPEASDSRGVNYAIELLRLATNETFVVTKAVHLCPGENEEDALEHARIKFTWLVNSALACRGLHNCRLAWMPFCFQPQFNQTLVAIDDGVVAGNDPANIMIGWGPGDRPGVVIDPDLTNDSDYSVMLWNEDHSAERPLGDFGRDVRGLFERIIHPLTDRLLHDFPVLKDGKVYLNNIEIIARILKFESEYEEAQRYLRERNTRAHIDTTVRTITAERLNGLFRWILKQGEIQQLTERHGILPWCEHDRNLIIERLNAN